MWPALTASDKTVYLFVIKTESNNVLVRLCVRGERRPDRIFVAKIGKTVRDATGFLRQKQVIVKKKKAVGCF